MEAKTHSIVVAQGVLTEFNQVSGPVRDLIDLIVNLSGGAKITKIDADGYLNGTTAAGKPLCHGWRITKDGRIVPGHQSADDDANSKPWATDAHYEVVSLITEFPIAAVSS